jgi:copper homeostasis protein
VAILEACVETVDEARAVEQGGASRIELCANLAEQGTTPDEMTIAACVAAVRIPVFVMVRPRTGNFVYTSEELASMRRQVSRARSLGASGIATGALRRGRTIDTEAMTAMLDAAGPLPLTCHRAFDLTPDRDEALETLIRLGAARVLTSGGAATADAGAGAIAALVRRAAGRIGVVAAGTIRAHNVRDVLVRTGATEVHAHVTSAAEVRTLVARLDLASPSPPG